MADSNLSAILRHVEALQSALAGQRRAAIGEAIGQLAALRAPMGGQWQQLAHVAAGIGEFGLARQAIDLFVDASDGTPAAVYQKAALFADWGLVPEAEAELLALPGDVPDPIGNAYSRGMSALGLGRMEEARRYLEQVTQARPDAGSAWLSLASLVDLSAEPALAGRIVAAEPALERAIPEQRAAWLHALGKVHADRGEPAAAFDAYARGARDMKAVARYDREQDAREADEAINGYSADLIARLASRQTEPTGRTIFVTGLPRSGTTLVEQVLTAHSDVAGGAEHAGLSLLAMEIGGRSSRDLARYTEVDGSAGIAALWDHWLTERFGAQGRIVDKTVDASRFLGLAAATLPDAPLVWLTRDPLDRAWSCFRTNFMGGAVPWSYDLTDIAAHFRLEDELLALWQDILGDRLLVLSYEALVTDPASQIRRLLAHCLLAEEPQVFAPHENARPVATASRVQVRRPIDRAGIGSAQPYRAFLQPFADAYYG